MDPQLWPRNEGISTYLQWFVAEGKVMYQRTSSSLFVDNGRALLCASDFLAAFIEMNRTVLINNLSNEDKRFVLFGADQILP